MDSDDPAALRAQLAAKDARVRELVRELDAAEKRAAAAAEDARRLGRMYDDVHDELHDAEEKLAAATARAEAAERHALDSRMELSRALADRDAARAENARLREALQHYAADSTWLRQQDIDPVDGSCEEFGEPCLYTQDGAGFDVARAALAATGAAGGETKP